MGNSHLPTGKITSVTAPNDNDYWTWRRRGDFPDAVEDVRKPDLSWTAELPALSLIQFYFARTYLYLAPDLD